MRNRNGLAILLAVFGLLVITGGVAFGQLSRDRRPWVIATQLTVLTDADVQGDLTVDGDLFAGNLAVIDGVIEIAEQQFAYDTLIVTETLDVLGTTTLSGSTHITGAVTMADDLDVDGDLVVTGAATVDDLDVGGDLTVVGLSTVDDLDVGGDLVVTGLTTVDDLDAGGDVTVVGTVIAAEVYALDVEITVGDELTDVVNIAIQLVDGHGAPVAESKALFFYLADDSDGLIPTSTDPDGGVTIGSDGSLLVLSTDPTAGYLISDETGAIDLDVEESGAESWYLVVILPNGSLAISDEIVFATE